MDFNDIIPKINKSPWEKASFLNYAACLMCKQTVNQNSEFLPKKHWFSIVYASL